jgi:hypothetical protein
MRLIAKARVYYPSGGGVEYQPGDSFETETDKDAEALVLVGMAEYPAKLVQKKTLTLKPTVPTETSADPIDLMAPGSYKRRDMRPED